MRNILLQELNSYFGRDEKRKKHARAVLSYAEKILEQEPGDQQIVIAAAILHDIGIHAAENKHGSSAGKFQEIEGPAIAKRILEEVSFPAEKIPEVLEIIAHHHSGGIDTDSFKIIWDADWLVNIPDEVGLDDEDKLRKLIDKIFLTQTGQHLAKSTYFS